MAKAEATETRSASLSKEELFLAYAAVAVLVGAIALTIGAIFTGG